MNDRQLIEDLLSALEYHTEQTRPIEFSKVAIEAAREYLRKPAQQWNAGVPLLYPKPEPGVSIKAEYEPTQPMHPEIKKMYEDYFDKCFRESSPTQQEPVAWFHPHEGFYWAKPTSISAPTIADVEPLPLYATPPQRKPLTDKAITKVIDSMPKKMKGFGVDWDLYEFARAIEAKPKENT